MKKYIMICIVAIIAIQGCKTNEVETNVDEGSIISFKFEKNKLKTDYDFSSIVDTTFEIIPLETNEQCLIAKVDKIEIRDNKIFILDILAKSVFIFDREGIFIDKISNIGRGRGEYLGITDMTTTDSTIIVIDRFSRKQLEYFHNGELLRESNMLRKVWANSIFTLNESIIYLNDWSRTNEGNFRLFSTHINNIEKNGIEKYLPFESKPLALGLESDSDHYSIYGDSVSFIFSGCDTIYAFYNGNVFPKYFVDFGKNKVIYRNGVENVFNDNPKGKVIGINCVSETKNYLFYNVNCIGNDYICIYDKIRNKHLICPEVLSSMYFNGIYCNFRTIIDEQIIKISNSHDIRLFYDEKYSKTKVYSPQFKNRFDDVMDGLDEQDNPVIFIFNLKDNV